VVQIPFKDIVAGASDSVKLKKLLINMVYVGVLAELLDLPEDAVAGAIAQQFAGKESVLESNRKAVACGRAYAREHLGDLEFPFKAETRPGGNDGRILIDGNAASGLGLVFGGCTFVAWYPITPSSSVIESFSELAERYRPPTDDGGKAFAVVQAEDELASIAMVIGAGWTGARAMTATSGPGLSLMAEAAGLAYYAEIPAVIWDVQRVGPSTGLPTRTMQGDVLKAYYLSHGDAKHVVLLPATINECFEFGQTAFDLAEELQTLVIVLSDLDLGMNLHSDTKFVYPERAFRRGKVLDSAALDRVGRFQRYKDVDGDGVPYRTLPGTKHPLAAYFTRGTGHDESGLYSEKPEVYKANVDRLARKLAVTAASMAPQPVADRIGGDGDKNIGIVYYGSSLEAVREARAQLAARGLTTDGLRLRALPLGAAFKDFLATHERVYIVEQNRDAQLMAIVRAELPELAGKCRSVLHYDGLPLDAESVFEPIAAEELR
jgi:2-oxoglutarate ferredoxin oxidoreductase subunit alpha